MGTTAIVAAAACAAPASAADKIQLELRGYAQFGAAGIVSEPDGGGGNRGAFGSDSEVHFRGKTILDNGLAISFQAQLELEDDPEVDDDADLIDEVYVQFDGGFGRIQFGMQDGVGDQMIISAPNVFSQFTISSIDMNPFEMYTSSDIDSDVRDILGESSYLDTSPDFSADHTKVIYFTPRIYGLQLGVSYAPNPCRNDTGLDVNTSAAGDSDPDTFFSCGNDDVFGSNYWEVAGNFEHEFDGFGVGVSASYGSGGGNDFGPALAGAVIDDGEADGPSEWHAGGELFFNLVGGRLTIGGAYKETDAIDAENTSITNLIAADFDVDATSSRHWDAGAKFGVGPWEFGGAYGRAQSTYVFVSSFDQETELTTMIGGVSYKMGPGIKLGLGVIHSDAEIGAASFENDLFSEGETDATAVFSELDLRF
ncbi:MAG: porin [Alphaproteobacteria bacterium]